jgi:hypothetical protein
LLHPELLLEEVLDPLTKIQMQLITSLELVRIESFIPNTGQWMGRPMKCRQAIVRAFIAKSVYNLSTTRDLIDRLHSDKNMRRICGWESRYNIPSESTFSRAFAEFAKTELPKRVHESLIKDAYEGEMVGHISRDSTAINAREKPQKKETKKEEAAQQAKVLPGTDEKPTITGATEAVNTLVSSIKAESCAAPSLETKEETNLQDNAPMKLEEESLIGNGIVEPISSVVVDKEKEQGLFNATNQTKESRKKVKKRCKKNGKRGRPKKNEEMVEIEVKSRRIEQQLGMTLPEMIKELPNVCDRGAKKNSQGYIETWNGYKLHIDTADNGIPISAILTSASLHDSQVAIPLAIMSDQRVQNFYDLMDAAYDVKEITEHSRSLNHVPIIDANPRRNAELQNTLESNQKAYKLLNWKPAEDVRYKARSGAERTNARLKDEFGGRTIRVRGPAKAFCHLMFGVLALAADQLMRLAA